MLISIRDCKYSKKDRHWIEYVYSEYVDSLADLNTGVYALLNPDNPQQDEIFANWFANEHSHPLVILRGPDPVGFALVTRPRVASSGGKSESNLGWPRCLPVSGKSCSTSAIPAR